MYKIITEYKEEFIINSKYTAEEIADFLNGARTGYAEFVTFENTENKHIVLRLSEIRCVKEL